MRMSDSLNTDFPEEHIAILQTLSRTGRNTLISISQSTELDSTYLASALLELARKGLVRRAVSLRGMWEITPSGRNVLVDRRLQ